MALVVLAFAACQSGGASSSSDRAGPWSADPGTQVKTSLSAEQQAELDALQAQLDAVKDLDAPGFAAKYAVPFTPPLGYDPLTAKGLDLVQASPVALADDERTVLAANGFVISNRKRYPGFVAGYQTIYAADLPVYLSADSILHAVHQSFDDILKTVESDALSALLGRILDTMRAGLSAGAGGGLSAAAERDADLFVAVAKGLLDGTFAAPVAGADATLAQSLFDAATAGSGAKSVALFGVPRDVDFSQFTPRGHYTETPQLSRYFRAMMWLGRIDLRILETQPDHAQVFRRRQLEAAYVLRALLDGAAVAEWKRLDDVIGAFVGEPDNMTLPQLDGLLAKLGIASPAELAQRSDAEIAQAIVDGRFGTQRISSHIMVNGLASGTMPLSSTFMFLGQRYVLDSHVFSNVVYDRVARGEVRRMMPDPLDVAFAALRNDQAGLLLGPEITKYRYAPDLASMRIVADAHPQEFWDESLYNHWLGALRTLSPTKDVASPSAVGLPKIAGTEPWGRRILQTQLASWAELRHDTILYAKQSYAGVPACEYPDAYVDPYPELYARIAAFAARGAALDLTGTRSAADITAYFGRLHRAASRLETMAKNQRAGAPQSAEDLAWVNDMLFTDGCGSVADYNGWYAELFFRRESGTQADPIVADVHTQPADEGGGPVGRVLHVGTGIPRAMVVTVDGCTGPRAYVGLASSYFEHVTENFDRLDDRRWSSMWGTKTDVPWMTGLVVR